MTLYVPVETPPEVVDYMNELKQEGMFSQGIIDILSEYVQRLGRTRPLDSGITHTGLSETAFSDPTVARPAVVQESTVERPTPTMESADSGLSAENPEIESTDDADKVGGDSRSSAPNQVSAKLNLAQIFQQAQRNSGKLLE